MEIEREQSAQIVRAAAAPTANLRSSIGVVGGLGVALALWAACATGESPANVPNQNTFGTDSGVGTGTDGDTECIPEDGTLWCGRRPNAFYDDGDPPADQVLYPQLDTPEGCTCVPNEIHDVLFDLLMSGEVPHADLLDGADLEDVRDEIFGPEATPLEPPDDSITACEKLVPLDGPGGDPWPNTCDSETALDTIPATMAIDYAGIYIGNRDNDSTCTFERCFEELHGSGPCSFMDGSYDVTLVSRIYEIGEDLFNDALEYPGCLLEEPGRIDDHSSGGYQFLGIDSGDLLDELGLENGDQPKTLNGSAIATVDKLYTTYDDLRDSEETEFTLVVSRCDGPECRDITLEYEVVP